MNKLTREQLRILTDAGEIANLSEEQLQEIRQLLDKHKDDVMSYMVDADSMHKLLAIAYVLEDTKESEVITRVANGIRKTFKRAKTITLSDMLTISEALIQLKKKEETEGEEQTEE